ncbi:MAG: hypothetical protein H5U13_07290 [Parvibaculum sp.]|nr:hypothetical protein [Parvibaculum sp.]
MKILELIYGRYKVRAPQGAQQTGDIGKVAARSAGEILIEQNVFDGVLEDLDDPSFVAIRNLHIERPEGLAFSAECLLNEGRFSNSPPPGNRAEKELIPVEECLHLGKLCPATVKSPTSHLLP